MDEKQPDFSREEARAFVARYDLKKIGEDQIDSMAAAMGRIHTAGLAVTRVASKFDSPAYVFTVPKDRART